MAQKSEAHQPHGPAGFADPAVMGFIAYVIFPILALITAGLGLILILNDRLVPGMIFLAILLQVWVVAALWAHFRRTRLRQNSCAESTDCGVEH